MWPDKFGSIGLENCTDFAENYSLEVKSAVKNELKRMLVIKVPHEHFHDTKILVITSSS